MRNVVVLEPREQMNRDLERLLAVGDSHPGVATESVDIAMEALTETLSQLAMSYRDRRLDDVVDEARRVAEQSRALGLNRAFRVGQAVAGLAASGDGVALSANVARLVRLGDAALSSVWDQGDAGD